MKEDWWVVESGRDFWAHPGGVGAWRSHAGHQGGARQELGRPLVRLFWSWHINPFGKCDQLLILASSLLTPSFQRVTKAAASVNKE